MEGYLYDTLVHHLNKMEQIAANGDDWPLVRMSVYLAEAVRIVGESSADATVKDLLNRMYEVYNSAGKETIVQGDCSEEGNQQ